MLKTATGMDVSCELGKVLYLAIELSKKTWLLGFAVGAGQKPRRMSVSGGDWQRLLREIERAKAHFGLLPDSLVVSCYEAGRDGFWLHRCLEQAGVLSLVVDAGSMRRHHGRRHRKTDRLDVARLLRDLMAYSQGDGSVWQVVRVPPRASEDVRQLQRERHVLKKEREAHRSRIGGLLFSRGIRIKSWRQLLSAGLDSLRTWDGEALGEELHRQLARELERLELVKKQMAGLEARRKELLKQRPSVHAKTLECVDRMFKLKGIGPENSWTYSTEMFGWREFKNRRQVGGFLGLGGTPYQSGAMDYDLGIGKDGPAWVRSMTIELAWGWLRFQPDSAQSRWFQERYGPGCKRDRRKGIVALARRLMIALWQYLEYGVIPEGAVLKSAAS
jgi:transposase